MNIIIEELNETHNYVEFCLLLQQLTTINLDEFTKEQFNDQLKLIKSNPYHKVMVAVLDGTIIGTITILIENKFIHNLSRVAHIEDVVVDNRCRLRGIGRSLIIKAIEVSKEFDCYKIILDCSENNLAFYEKFGFVKKEHQMALYVN